jgi:triacylglycerol esterase/lipase EstA (alpha/beta hydrolase family)
MMPTAPRYNVPATWAFPSPALRLVAAAVAVFGLLIAAPAAETKAQPAFNRNPVIFVHGFVGSGAQFESQKMRFTSNGYP